MLTTRIGNSEERIERRLFAFSIRYSLFPTRWPFSTRYSPLAQATASEEILPVRHYDWIAHFGRRTPHKVAVVDLGSGRQFTYAQFDARISRLAAHLRDRLGIKRGDRVAVLDKNTPLIAELAEG